jgi:hypothetical protein
VVANRAKHGAMSARDSNRSCFADQTVVERRPNRQHAAAAALASLEDRDLSPGLPQQRGRA